jgi:hypothetical protein
MLAYFINQEKSSSGSPFYNAGKENAELSPLGGCTKLIWGAA